ncbi:hypothetical protein DPX16_8066 [Anabarilius grahami]|uniref:Uncharacterized protein n=1 Tax=Anabarilius grahami TaxID=495550 RepID=A0A3N0XWF9_ANAGA|nr:hypothetical protein DPX16_8066 [Anabarilius grahami]
MPVCFALCNVSLRDVSLVWRPPDRSSFDGRNHTWKRCTRWAAEWTPPICLHTDQWRFGLVQRSHCSVMVEMGRLLLCEYLVDLSGGSIDTCQTRRSARSYSEKNHVVRARGSIHTRKSKLDSMGVFLAP